MQINEENKGELCNVSRFYVGVVAARFNQQIVDKLLAAAREELNARGVKKENIDVLRVAGSIEIPLALQLFAK
ncbi:MAG: 6,7-dimethyl-8-ribityllumazine synthase, partial [Patescibacteria group bacterium]